MSYNSYKLDKNGLQGLLSFELRCICISLIIFFLGKIWNLPYSNEEKWVDSSRATKKGRGRPKIILVELVKKDMS